MKEESACRRFPASRVVFLAAHHHLATLKTPPAAVAVAVVASSADVALKSPLFLVSDEKEGGGCRAREAMEERRALSLYE